MKTPEQRVEGGGSLQIHMRNVIAEVQQDCKQSYEAKLSLAECALLRITQISNKDTGADWDEIQEARDIAQVALNAIRGDQQPSLKTGERIRQEGVCYHSNCHNTSPANELYCQLHKVANAKTPIKYFSFVSSYEGAVFVGGRWKGIMNLNYIDKSGWVRHQGPPSDAMKKAALGHRVGATEMFPELRLSMEQVNANYKKHEL